MALLSQLLGNRELAFEDQLEKGRIWMYGDGNEYTFLCNGFCWKPPGCGIAVIEIWGAGGSVGRGCCCGGAVPGNPGAYARKTICVCPANYVCGTTGRACGDTPLNCRGCSQATCVCWFGCAPCPVYYGGNSPEQNYKSWKGNNPWGWGNGETMGNIKSCDGTTKYFSPRSTHSEASILCCAAGATTGCLCAQGGKSGVWWCTDGNMNPYQCFMRTGYCTRIIGRLEICGWHNCGIVCNVCQDLAQPWNNSHKPCAFGGDMSCCGSFSCVRFLNCVDNDNGCTYQYQSSTPAMMYSTEGGNFTFPGDHDSPSSPTSGGGVLAMLSGISTLSRAPSHLAPQWCWSGARACGCYEAFGCIPMSPMGMPGYPSKTCGDVRDHGGRGGMGGVRIRYIPTDGGDTY